MTSTSKNVQTGWVSTEGDELYYEVHGQGPPLLMIPGGGGDSRLYSFVTDILCDEYKVILYDRRGNARSTRNDPQNFEISQQSRDAVAVLQAVGETSALVFGSSSGAIIALDMAKTHPLAVRAAIPHEPPTVRVLPDSKKWLHYFAGLHHTAYSVFAPIAILRFGLMIGWPVINGMRKADIPHESGDRMRENDDFFMQQELIPVITYKPDVEQIKRNRAKVFMAAGQWTLDKQKVYGRAVPILAEMLGCEMVTFPGHHNSYVEVPEAWSAVLRDILHRAA